MFLTFYNFCYPRTVNSGGNPNMGYTNQPGFTSRLSPGVRVFAALFDYDPHTMSPNPDNDYELSFREGDLVKVGIPCCVRSVRFS